MDLWISVEKRSMWAYQVKTTEKVEETTKQHQLPQLILDTIASDKW